MLKIAVKSQDRVLFTDAQGNVGVIHIHKSRGQMRLGLDFHPDIQIIREEHLCTCTELEDIHPKWICNPDYESPARARMSRLDEDS